MENGLALSGGGSKGAFTVGVLKKLLRLGETFDLLSGTSTGSLIVPLIATGEIELLERIYTSVEDKDILIKFSDAELALRILTNDSLYEISPLVNLIRKTIDNERYNRIMASGKKIFLSTVCLQNGKTTYFTNADIPGSGKYNISKWKNRDEFIRCIAASCVQPVLMPPVDIGGLKFVDGGVREYVPTDILIDAGAESITAILTTPGESYFDSTNFNNVKDILLKTIEIFSNDVSDNDVRIASLYNKGITYIAECKERIQRNTGMTDDVIENLFTSATNPFFGKRKLDLKIIRPKKNLGDGLDFNKRTMSEQLAYGFDIVPDTFSIT